MKKIVLTVPLLCLFIIGCQGSEKKAQTNIKASELINKEQPPENKIITVNLNIYLFRIKTRNLPFIQYEIEESNTLPLNYQNADSFVANGIIACGTDNIGWQKIGALIENARIETEKHINLLITENLSDNVIINEITKPVSMIYYSDDVKSGIGFDVGRMILRLKVSPLKVLRQTCMLDVLPVYVIKNPQSRNRQFAFNSASFSVSLQPGQCVLLAPADERQKPTELQNLGNILFYLQKPENTADLCLITCSSMNNPQ